MTLTFKKAKILSILIVCQTLLSCSKSVSEDGAIKVAGTFKGKMTITTYGDPNSGQYNDYIVKVEHSSNEKVLISCASAPKGFDNSETVVSMINGTIRSYGSPTVDLFYETTSNQMILNVTIGLTRASFIGQKQ